MCVLLPEMERIVTAGDALRGFLPQWMKKGLGDGLVRRDFSLPLRLLSTPQDSSPPLLLHFVSQLLLLVTSVDL